MIFLTLCWFVWLIYNFVPTIIWHKRTRSLNLLSRYVNCILLIKYTYILPTNILINTIDLTATQNRSHTHLTHQCLMKRYAYLPCVTASVPSSNKSRMTRRTKKTGEQWPYPSHRCSESYSPDPIVMYCIS